MDTGLKEMKHRLIGSSVFLVVLMYFTMGHMVGVPGARLVSRDAKRRGCRAVSVMPDVACGLP